MLRGGVPALSLSLSLSALVACVGCGAPGVGGRDGGDPYAQLPTLGELQPAEPLYDMPPQPEARQRLVRVDRAGRDGAGDDADRAGQAARGAMSPRGTARRGAAGAGGVRVQRLAFARDDYRVDLALDFADRDVLPADLAERWEANGLHVASVARDGLAMLEANLPRPHRMDVLHLTPTRHWQPLELIGRIKGTQVARLRNLNPVVSPADLTGPARLRADLTDQMPSKDPDKPNAPNASSDASAASDANAGNAAGATEGGSNGSAARTKSSDSPGVQRARFRGGEHRLLLQLARGSNPGLGATGPMRLHILPQHHRARRTLLPRMPQEQVTDGQLFKELQWSGPPPTDAVWLIWGDPPSQSPLYRERPAETPRPGQPDRPEPGSPQPGGAQQRDTTDRSDTPRTDWPNLGQVMFNGQHRKGAVRLVVVIAPMHDGEAGPVLQPPARGTDGPAKIPGSVDDPRQGGGERLPGLSEEAR